LIVAISASTITAISIDAHANNCSSQNASCLDESDTYNGYGVGCAGAGLEGTATWGTGVWGQDWGGGIGVAGVYGFSGFGSQNMGTGHSMFDEDGYCSTVASGPAGVVGNALGYSGGSSYGVVGTAAQGSGGGPAYGLYGTGTYGAYASGTSYGIYALATTGDAVYGNSNSGAGVYGTSGGYDGVHGEVTNSARAAVAGINRDTSSGTGTGVYGQSFDSGYGVYGTSTNGDGVYGYLPSGTTVTGTAGVAGDNESTDSSCGGANCFGVWGASHAGVGVYGQSYGANGYGVYAENFAGGYAIYGAANSSLSSIYGINAGAGAAVNGYNTSGDTNAIGVIGASGEYGYGVKGVAGTAVWGHGTGAGSLSTGIYGDCSNGSSSCYAGYFNGNVDIETGCLQFGGTDYYGTCTSDQRLKRNIEPVKSALERLSQLNGVTYEWKDPAADGHVPGPVTGFLAQDVEKVFPKWVGEGKDGFKTLDIPPRELAALEVEAFKTLKMENDALKERMAALESGRQPRISGFNMNGVGFGVGGLAIAGAAVIISRRKREEKSSPKL
jgi:hypothetical protein